MSGRNDALVQAKLDLDVTILWRVLKLPGKPQRSCRCPFHDDKNESFSVYTGRSGRLKWKCFGTCGQGGPVEFLAVALDVPEKEACRRLVEMAGTNAPQMSAQERVWPAPKIPTERRLVLPVGLRVGTAEELRKVANLRRLSLEGVRLASGQGLLRFATPQPHGHPAWIVMDQAKVNAQVRRLDGGTWEHIGGKKAWTLPGSRAPWPIGVREAQDFPMVVLVEGGPDLLAACHFTVAEGREKDVAAVAMLGAANRIPEDALLLLANKRVRIFPHADEAGAAAAIRWTLQLERVGCEVDAFRFGGLRRANGQPVGDLNDLANVDADDFEAEQAELLEVLPR